MSNTPFNPEIVAQAKEPMTRTINQPPVPQPRPDSEVSNNIGTPAHWKLEIAPKKCFNDGQFLMVMVTGTQTGIFQKQFVENLAYNQAGNLGLSGRVSIADCSPPFAVDPETLEQVPSKPGCLWGRYVKLTNTL